MTRIFAVLAATVAVGGLGAAWLVTQKQTTELFENCRASAVAGGAGAIGGAFELLNAQGETVTDTDVITEPTLVYFGYTYCPDVCPLDVSRNAEAVDLLADGGISTTPVFISIDPERDTPEVVGDFAFNLHEKMIGLTGSPEQVKAASRAYKTFYQKQDGDPEYYLVNHSTYTYLVLPEHGFVEFFKRDAPAEDMAERVSCFVESA
ncbi:SCO family protein [Epibacterium ulvae]|uniref:SCO family protein n=1 Tax=Epibacterium ulvae TaxID=1156985 RepID=UPI001BFCB2C6|nr:SCO family protein [Epibacterium ulvae]MBT8153624.1 SCO family protein [Epibacterium ulvae]